MKKARKKSPAIAIAGKVVEAQVHRDGAQPTARAWVLAQFRKAFKRLKKNLLDDVLGLGLAGEQAHGGAEKPMFW